LLFSCVRHSVTGAFPQIPFRARFRAVGVFAALLTAGLAGGCSIAVPMDQPSALWRGNPEDVTGSVKERRATLSPALDAEDWRRASAAMATALDPQGAGGAVNWDNPQSGAKGSFTPIGPAYPKDARICRAFLADVDSKDEQEKLQGAACREKSAEWTLTEVKPFKKG
jgi:surface antigen